ncbi:MAG: GNAT family N-acetyltransferase [Bradymonadia bacterium]
MKHPSPTPRLAFRLWRVDDLDLAQGLWGDPRVAALISARGHFDVGEVSAMLQGHIESQVEHGIQYWPMFHRESGAHVGCAGLRPHDLEKNVVEFGVHLRPAHWGLGFAREAAQSVLEHAFEVYGASAVFAGHHPDNQSSKKMLVGLGFRYTEHALYPPTGRMHPGYVIKSPG